MNTLDLKEAPPEDIGSQLQVKMPLFHLFNQSSQPKSLLLSESSGNLSEIVVKMSEI